MESSDPSKKKKAKKADKKDKKKAKKKSSSHWLHHKVSMTRFIHTFGLLSIRGDSGSGSSADDDNESDFTDQQYEDSAATFGLGKRDLIRGADCPNAIDLEPRAMALTLSAITPAMIANDLFECGGELEALLRDRAVTAKRNKSKSEQMEAVFQMKTAGTVWKRRMADLVMH
ncbi:unnamed protein product, partial [Symbiodinium microadriaticum]